MGRGHEPSGTDSPSAEGRIAGDVSYSIRPFELDDLGTVQELFTAIRGTEPSRAWLKWKFIRNPAVGDECMFVADSDVGIIGIIPFYPVRLRYGGTRFDGTCFVNLMVHPDYQGEGVFTALRNDALDYLGDRTDLVFGFTNSNSRPIYRHWGETEVGPMYAHFRFQNPEAIFPGGRLWRKPVAYLNSWGTRSYLAVRDRVSTSPSNVSVTKTEAVPAARLAALYRHSVPEALHVVRDTAYYRWRLGAPDRSGDVYIATRSGEDIAALITRHRQVTEEITRIEVADVLPIVPNRAWTSGFRALLDRLIHDHRDADVISICSSSMPKGLLREYGFISNTRFPYSSLSRRVYVTLTLFVTPFTDTAFDISDQENWNMSELTINTD